MNTQTLPPSTWTTGTTEVIKTGTWRAALPVYYRPPSPCRLACPVNGHIADWIQQAAAKDFFGAWTTLTENNPFPAVAGRVCHHPCESACNRAGYDEPLAIRALERYIGELALAEGWQFPEAPLSQDRVAIVGGGPSGLSAAYQLRRRGYAVTIFEAQRELGGLLRDGIPPYRLPRAVLDGEIRRILALGIDVHAGVGLASGEQFLKLRAEYGAVYRCRRSCRRARQRGCATGQAGEVMVMSTRTRPGSQAIETTRPSSTMLIPASGSCTEFSASRTASTSMPLLHCNRGPAPLIWVKLRARGAAIVDA